MIAASTATAAWVAAGAAVPAAIITVVLATVAVLQMRSSDRQVEVMREHVAATDRLARAAENEAHRQQMQRLGSGTSIYSSPERQMAEALEALRRIAMSFARAFLPPAATETGEPLQDEPNGGDRGSEC